VFIIINVSHQHWTNWFFMCNAQTNTSILFYVQTFTRESECECYDDDDYDDLFIYRIKYDRQQIFVGPKIHHVTDWHAQSV